MIENVEAKKINLKIQTKKILKSKMTKNIHDNA